MKTARIFILAAFVCLGAALSPILSVSPAHAGKAGSFANALKSRFCGGTSGATWYGCYAYMHYRVDWNKSRDSAKSSCYKTGCGSKYGGNPAGASNCRRGCDQAYNADTP